MRGCESWFGWGKGVDCEGVEEELDNDGEAAEHDHRCLRRVTGRSGSWLCLYCRFWEPPGRVAEVGQLGLWTARSIVRRICAVLAGMLMLPGPYSRHIFK